MTGNSPAAVALRKLAHSRSALIGVGLCAAFAMMALLAPWLAPYSYKKLDLAHRLMAPGQMGHWLGTDNLGRDLLSRLIYGSRVSLAVGIFSVSISLIVGVPLGALAGYAGRWIDSVIMRAMDLLLAFPSILLAITIVTVLGNDLKNAMIAVGVVGIPVFARITRASVISVKELEYVQAARTIGCSPARILTVHILPNCANPLIVQATLSLGTSVLDAAGLSFLGLGARPPTPEWGTMLGDTYRYYDQAPWLVIGPGLAILAMVLGFNLLGDGLRDALDPKTKEE
ncbi:MAG: ABC transporter permease [Candidatus Eremiobacteraeota bacterium]|nr:ABC transporter permease [Candidatus Eremiobacteraeota bacterium]MCW5865838.1 ABC transporter permease [Candidatus Eremiobacteraeota bacterium]